MAETALKAKPQALVTVGKRDRSLVGWKYTAVESHLLNHLTRSTWCDVACLARTCFSRNTPANQTAVRQRLRAVGRRMIDSKRFLVIEYATNGHGNHGEAQRFKIYNGATEDERQAALGQLERMRRLGEINEAKYTQTRLILCADIP